MPTDARADGRDGTGARHPAPTTAPARPRWRRPGVAAPAEVPTELSSRPSRGTGHRSMLAGNDVGGKFVESCPSKSAYTPPRVFYRSDTDVL
jgi:hypothetical protein